MRRPCQSKASSSRNLTSTPGSTTSAPNRVKAPQPITPLVPEVKEQAGDPSWQTIRPPAAGDPVTRPGCHQNDGGGPSRTNEYGEFIWRILRAYSRRVADGDIEALSFMTGLADELDDAIAQAVKGLRTQGYSWTEIGDRLNITRQAARQRWTGR